jgi:hypothetical protein
MLELDNDSLVPQEGANCSYYFNGTFNASSACMFAQGMAGCLLMPPLQQFLISSQPDY